VGLRRVTGPWVGAGSDHSAVSVCVNIVALAVRSMKRLKVTNEHSSR
jgi:hypothetical protein